MATQGRGKPSDSHTTESFEEFQRQSNITLEDLESQTSDLSGIKDSVEVPWDGRSKYPSMPIIAESSSSESHARKTKRQLEKKFQDIRRLNPGSQVMHTLKEEDESNETTRVGLSMKDFLMPSCSLGGGGYNAASYAAQFNSIHSPENSQSIKDNQKVTISELYDLGEHFPIEGPPYQFESYNSLGDVTGEILEHDRENCKTKGDQDHDVMAESFSPSKDENKNLSKSLGWARNVEPSDKEPQPYSTKTRILARFGRKKKNQWDENVDISPISPDKRYRRGERGQLVPRRFAREHADDGQGIHIASSDCDMNDPSIVLLPGPSIDESEANSGSSAQKNRPPMLNLNDLEESEESDQFSEKEEEFDVSLNSQPSGIIGALGMLNVRGIQHGQDPDGFALTKVNSRLAEYKDPPTASEHRQTIAAQRLERKSALRKRGSPKRLRKDDRVKFKNKDDKVPLGLGVDSI